MSRTLASVSIFSTASSCSERYTLRWSSGRVIWLESPFRVVPLGISLGMLAPWMSKDSCKSLPFQTAPSRVRVTPFTVWLWPRTVPAEARASLAACGLPAALVSQSENCAGSE